jgi:hypothetical protein
MSISKSEMHPTGMHDINTNNYWKLLQVNFVFTSQYKNSCNQYVYLMFFETNLYPNYVKTWLVNTANTSIVN